MNDEIKYLHLCGRLMTGKSVDCNYVDAIKADNILYGDFGMSSEDILDKFMSGTYECLCK